MNAQFRQYAFALIFLGIGIFQLVKKDSLEATLYLLAGAAFIFNSLASESRFVRYKRPIVITTWVLIISVGILFLYLLQFKYL
ncbi:MAG TPA: hypothetical protein VK666_19695 [Chryseolinea sp.]|nr:hypothetical protein [Chryseolinea sp.]